MLRRALMVAGWLLLPVLTSAQAPAAAPSLEGVWKLVEIVTTGAGASANDNPWPSLILFTKKYYSFLSVDGIEPRPRFQGPRFPPKPTDAEKVARYEELVPFTANSGTYDISGTTLGFRPLVGQYEGDMGYRVTQEFKLDGNTLWLTAKSPDSETRRKLTRLE